MCKTRCARQQVCKTADHLVIKMVNGKGFRRKEREKGRGQRTLPLPLYYYTGNDDSRWTTMDHRWAGSLNLG